MYECPNCAGNLKFDIARQQLYCEYCDTTVDPYQYHKERDAEETTAEGIDGETSGKYSVTVFTCPQCGGQILSEDTTAATFCSFCGASTILDSRISRQKRPRYIIPFTKTKEDCRKSYARMMRRAFFAPEELKNAELIERFRGIYMPYWVYSFGKKGGVSFSGRRTYRRGDYRITDHYQLDCEIEAEYRGLAYDASASFSDNLSAAIAPFDLRQGKAFVPSFLSGFCADTNDVEKDVYQTEAEEMAIRDGRRALAGNPVCRKYHAGEGTGAYSLDNALRPSERTAELAMLPVWFLAYRNGERVSYAVVNGQTGKAAADLPVDRRKYLTGSLVLALPLFILLNLFLTITPGRILLLSAFLALLCALVANVQITRILARESGQDDRGLASRRPAAGEEVLWKKRRRRWNLGNTGGFGKAGLLLLLFLGSALLPSVLIRIMSRTGRAADGANMAVFIMVMLAMIYAAVRALGGRNPGKSRNFYKRMSRYGGHFREKWRTLVKPFAGIGTAIVILIVKPVSDWFYYMGAFLCMGMVLWTIMDIIKHHNLLATRSIPKFIRKNDNID